MAARLYVYDFWHDNPGADEGLIGWSLMVSAGSEIPIFFLLSKYGDKIKELPLLTFASLMFALRFLLMALAVFIIFWSSVSGLLSGAFGGLLFEAAGRPAFYQLAALLALIAGLGFLYRHLFAKPEDMNVGGISA